MAKKRTGLQSEIAGIFSGVPVPKKGGQRSQPGGPSPKPGGPSPKPGGPSPTPGGPASRPGGSVIPRPVAPVTPTPQQPVKPLPATPRPKVTEVKVPEQITRQIPPKISRRRKDKLFAPKAGVGSSRQKTGIILFVLLSAVLVIVLARPYLRYRINPDNSPTDGKTDTGNSIRANIEIDWPMPTVYSADLRDPMELGSRQQKIIETSTDLVVVGITWSENRKFATIGTQTVQEGDIVQGTKIRIITINRNSVEFEEDEKTWTQEVKGKAK